MTGFLLCSAVGFSSGFAANAGDDSVSSTAQQALRLAYENEGRIGTVERALFHQRFVLNETEFLVEFGWDSDRQYQRVGDTEHRVYDGVNAASFRIGGSKPSLTIRNNAHDVLHGWPEWNLNDMFPLRQHWWGREAESSPPLEYEPLGSQVIDGVNCFVYAGIGNTFDYRPQAKRVWVDSSGHVRQLEEYLGSFTPDTPPAKAMEDGKLYRRITYRKHQQYGQMHVPTILVIEGFGEYVGRTITTNLVDFLPRFTANTFVINIPNGTKVYDASREPPVAYTYPPDQMSEAALQERRAEAEQELMEQRKAEKAQSELIGKMAPEPSVDKWLNSDAHSLNDLKGKWVLLNFTSIACGPCIGTIPMLNEVLGEFKNKPIQVVSVHTHVPKGNYPDILAYIEKRGIKYPLVVSSKDPNHSWGKVFSAYHVHGIPRAALIDPNGRIVSHEDIWQAIARLRKEFYWGDSIQSKTKKSENEFPL